MERLRLELPLLLPEGEDCPHCLGRIQERLHAHKGISRVHLQGKDASLLCLHFDPLLITAEEVEQQVRRAGVALVDHYGHLRLSLEGLDCADCAQTVEQGLRRLPGVLHATVAPVSGTLRVEYDRQVVRRARIEDRVRELGYEVAPQEGTWTFQVEGLDCADCAVHIEEGVAALEGVRDVRLNFAAGKMEVQARQDPALQRSITDRVRQLGYRAQVEGDRASLRPVAPMDLIAFLRRSRTARWALGAGLSMVIGLILSLLPIPPWGANVAFSAAILLAGIPVARAGWAALRLTHSLDINALMVIASLGAMAVGEFAEGAMGMVLFAVGELLEGYTMERARGAIRALMDLSPAEATRLISGEEEQVPVEQLRVNDHIRVRPGERIPADGQILEGHSSVNQAAITGESIPVDKASGDTVYAGTLNGEGVLLIEVSKRVEDSTLARIIAMVEEAQARKAPAQRFVDRFARIYTPAVVAAAVLVALLPPLLGEATFQAWIYRALVLLVIACPCALVISTPVSIAAAVSSAARRGVLIKGGAYLEGLGRLRALALDKTGTMTEGRPRVTTVVAYDGHSEAQVLRMAAAVETGSTHPLAQAVLHETRHRGLTPPPAQDLRALTGRGASARIEGERFYVGNHTFFEAWEAHPAAVCQEVEALEAAGQTVILVGTEDEVWGLLALADQLRPGSQAVVEELRRAGLDHVVILTGDNQGTAMAIAQEAGVDDVRANLLPGQKVDAIEALLRRFGSVGMVGDGVNDAPALARATVGVAMGAIGSDAALETADVALMADDMAQLPWTIRLGRRTRQIVAQNIVFSLAIKALFMGLALAGWATLWMAVFADVGASILVILNGMRLLRRRE